MRSLFDALNCDRFGPRRHLEAAQLLIAINSGTLPQGAQV